MKQIISFAIILIAPILLFASNLPKDSYNVGYKKINIFSELSHENFPLALVYPTKIPSKKVKFGPFKMNLSIGSKIANGKFPLVIISHGSGGTNLGYRDIAFFLVQHGYIVAMPLHPKNNFKNNEYEGKTINWENRPKHIISSINTLLSNKNISKSIDKEKIAIIGHSAGGYTALAVAGGVANTKHIIDLCKEKATLNEPFCSLVKENKIKSKKIDKPFDKRIKAIVLLAPVGVLFKSKNSLEKVNIPTLILKAQKDDELTEPYNSDTITKNFKNKNLLTSCEIPNAGHYSFITPFPKSIEKEVGIVAKDPKGFNRKKFQKTLSLGILDFLNQSLNNKHSKIIKLNCDRFIK